MVVRPYATSRRWLLILTGRLRGMLPKSKLSSISHGRGNIVASTDMTFLEHICKRGLNSYATNQPTNQPGFCNCFITNLSFNHLLEPPRHLHVCVFNLLPSTSASTHAFVFLFLYCYLLQGVMIKCPTWNALAVASVIILFNPPISNNCVHQLLNPLHAWCYL